MSKHTPGPWRFGHKRVFKLETDDRLSLDVLIRGGNQKDNTANARLIAAAPDLLEFAQYWLSRQGDDENYMTDKAKAAINKATGEQP